MRFLWAFHYYPLRAHQRQPGIRIFTAKKLNKFLLSGFFAPRSA
jgi:hypothetical protein